MARALGILALVAIAGVIAAITLVRPGAPPAASPTPTASPTVSRTEGPTATPSPSATATASPSPSPAGGRYVDAEVGYSVELTPPWRKSGCFGSRSGVGGEAVAHDWFLTARAYDEESGHTGIPHDLVEIHAQPNPDRITPRQWWDSGRAVTRRGSGAPVVDGAFQGRPAVRSTDDLGADLLVFASDTHMFEIRSQDAPTSTDNTKEQRDAFIATIRVLTAAELAAARAVPTPTQAPRSPEQVAAALADGLARKDVAPLASVIHQHCVMQAVVPGGGSSMSSEKWLDQLRDRFARGLVVTVESGAPTQAPGLDNPNMILGGVWKEPGQPDIEIDLLISRESSDRWAWGGVLYYTTGRP